VAASARPESPHPPRGEQSCEVVESEVVHAADGGGEGKEGSPGPGEVISGAPDGGLTGPTLLVAGCVWDLWADTLLHRG
jgi:hypothetical protein